MAHTSILLSIIKGSQARNSKKGRNLEAGAQAEAMEGATYWLAPQGLLSLLSYRTQPRDSTTHNDLGPPPSITS